MADADYVSLRSLSTAKIFTADQKANRLRPSRTPMRLPVCSLCLSARRTTAVYWHLTVTDH